VLGPVQLQRDDLAHRLASNGYLTDVLTDVNGISLHRFQLVAWTIIIGAIFVVDVYRNLALPTFDATILALLGISAGTYLGFKVPEQPE
jgi:ABC-type Mn2+/Zn2+ transport system permease subunit